MSAPATQLAGNDDEPNGPLLPLRTAIVFLLAFVAAGVVVALIVLAGHSVAEGMLAGLGALAASIKFFHWMIG